MKKILLLLWIALAGLPTGTALADEPSTTPAANQAPKVLGDADQAAEAWNRIGDGALLIDVRSAEEYQSGHIEGAINIPHTNLDGLIQAIGDDTGRSVVVYCRSGRRSGSAQESLESMGYDNVFNATGYSALKATQP